MGHPVHKFKSEIHFVEILSPACAQNNQKQEKKSSNPLENDHRKQSRLYQNFCQCAQCLFTYFSLLRFQPSAAPASKMQLFLDPPYINSLKVHLMKGNTFNH